MKRIAAVVCLALALPASAQSLRLSRVYATGGRSLTTRFGQSDLQSLGIELSHLFSPRTEVAIGFASLSMKQPKVLYGDVYNGGEESLFGVSSSLLVRRYFNNDGSARPYVEMSTGPMWSQKRVPASTSHFNFISQAGAGIAFRRITLGWRFSHISNAGYAPRNPGVNVNSLLFGVKLGSHLEN